MSDLRDLSKLPREEAYWDRLESRITAELGPLVRAGSARPADWWAPLAARAWALGALAAAAAVAAVFVLPARPADPDTSSIGLFTMPAYDQRMVTFISAVEPPPVGVLMLAATESGR